MELLVSRLTAAVRRPRLRLRAFYERHAVPILLGPPLVLLTIFALWQSITVNVPAGHAGVKWYMFLGGTDTATSYTEGIHFIWPWDSMALYDLRLQVVSRDFDILTKDGLMMSVTISGQFRLNERRLADLHKAVGTRYVETMVIPAIGSYARAVLSQYSTDEIYTTNRMGVQDEIRQAILRDLVAGPSGKGQSANPWVELKDVFISSMQFPAEVQAAINRKMEQYQIRQEYSYRLDREELESRRKEVEARGIAQFQTIVGAGISDNYLRWKGIDATLALARSPNAKIVVIGANRDGLPILLGGTDAQLSPTVHLESGTALRTKLRADGNDILQSTIAETTSGLRSGQKESPAVDLDPLPSTATQGE